MDKPIFSRRGHISALRNQNVHAILVAFILGLYAFLGFVRDDVLPYGVDKKWWGASVQAHLTILDFLGAASWQSWLIVALVGMIVLIFEASYRLRQKESREVDDKISKLEGEISRLTVLANARATKEGLLDQLGKFVMTGNTILVRCANETAEPPIEVFEAWSSNASYFLQTELGSHYAARFVSPAGLPLSLLDSAQISHAFSPLLQCIPAKPGYTSTVAGTPFVRKGRRRPGLVASARFGAAMSDWGEL